MWRATLKQSCASSEQPSHARSPGMHSFSRGAPRPPRLPSTPPQRLDPHYTANSVCPLVLPATSSPFHFLQAPSAPQILLLTLRTMSAMLSPQFPSVLADCLEPEPIKKNTNTLKSTFWARVWLHLITLHSGCGAISTTVTSATKEWDLGV